MAENADSVRDDDGRYVGKIQPNCAKGDHVWCSLSMLCACSCHPDGVMPPAPRINGCDT